jgi:hypothetical protein
MTKKDGATDLVQAISDVCHALRHADVDANAWFHSRNLPWPCKMVRTQAGRRK